MLVSHKSWSATNENLTGRTLRHPRLLSLPPLTDCTALHHRGGISLGLSTHADMPQLPRLGAPIVQCMYR